MEGGAPATPEWEADIPGRPKQPPAPSVAGAPPSNRKVLLAVALIREIRGPHFIEVPSSAAPHLRNQSQSRPSLWPAAFFRGVGHGLALRLDFGNARAGFQLGDLIAQQ